MLTIKNYKRFAEIRNQAHKNEEGKVFNEKIDYLGTYGGSNEYGNDLFQVVLVPSSKEGEQYIDVYWLKHIRNGEYSQNADMQGALVRHSDGSWGIHT